MSENNNFSSSNESNSDSIEESINSAVKQAKESYKKKDFKTASIAFEKVYRLSPSDTVFLYNAATVSTESKNYNHALKLYQGLKDLGYDGDEILFIATNRDIGQEESFADKKQHDLALKSGTHRKPREKRYPSKRADIIKNIVFIYVKQSKVNEALKAFEEARNYTLKMPP